MDETTKTTAPAAEAITVQVIDARQRIARVGQVDLPFRLDEHGQPWIECEPYGRWLGYARPRDARKLAQRLREDGIINDSEFRATVAQSRGGRPATEVWLTRKGAAKLAARSDTPRAIAMLDVIVSVCDAVVSGRAPDSAPDLSPGTLLLQQVGNALQQAIGRVVELEQQQRAVSARVDHAETWAAEQTRRIAALEARTARAPGGISAMQLAYDAGWRSDRGYTHNNALILACINAGFFGAGYMHQQPVLVRSGVVGDEWVLTSPGVAAFYRHVQETLPLGARTTITPNDTAHALGFHRAYHVTRRELAPPRTALGKPNLPRATLLRGRTPPGLRVVGASR